jgi:hypothetical protein
MARPSSPSNLSLADIDRMIQGRRKDLNKLHEKRKKLQRELDRYDRSIAAIGGSNGRGLSSRAGRRPRNERSLRDTIAQVLEKVAGPTSVGDILDKVQASGYRSSSANFRLMVNLALMKDKRFQRAGRGLYVLREKETSKTTKVRRRARKTAKEARDVKNGRPQTTPS